jgi:two-component system, chemotaxis family, protein-glutamate methylesterase/glutaminase
MLRVIIADDSPTARQLLEEILRSDPEIHVVGVAQNGHEIVELAKKLRPDLAVIDVCMPGMDGFEATQEIMTRVPTPIVLVSASTMMGEVDTGMKALQAGALTLLLKPSGPQSPGFDKAGRDLIATIKAMADVKVVRQHRRRAPEGAAAQPSQRPAAAARMVAIAASTGGPPALQRILSGLPLDFPAPILVVQHMALGFMDGFAAWLDLVVPLKVKIAVAGEPLVAGTVYIAPENRHLGVSGRHTIVLRAEPPIGGFRPSATYLFESVAETFGDSTIAVILTGMGEDGVAGLRHVRRTGGFIIAQDEATCVVYGMPGAAVDANVVDLVRPLGDIPGLLVISA